MLLCLLLFIELRSILRRKLGARFDVDFLSWMIELFSVSSAWKSDEDFLLPLCMAIEPRGGSFSSEVSFEGSLNGKILGVLIEPSLP